MINKRLTHSLMPQPVKAVPLGMMGGQPLILPNQSGITDNKTIRNLTTGSGTITGLNRLQGPVYLSGALVLNNSGDYIKVGSGTAKISSGIDNSSRLAFDAGNTSVEWNNCPEWYFPGSGNPEIELWSVANRRFNISNGSTGQANLWVKNNIKALGLLDVPLVSGARIIGTDWVSSSILSGANIITPNTVSCANLVASNEVSGAYLKIKANADELAYFRSDSKSCELTLTGAGGQIFLLKAGSADTLALSANANNTGHLFVNNNGSIYIPNTLTSNGLVSCASLITNNTISCASLIATTKVSSAYILSTGTISGAQILSTGLISGATILGSTLVSGATVVSDGDMKIKNNGSTLTIPYDSSYNLTYGSGAGITMPTGSGTGVYVFNTNTSSTTGIYFNIASAGIEFHRGGSSAFRVDLTSSAQGTVIMKTYNQATEPTTTQCPAGSMCFWTDTDDSKCYLCYNHGGTVKTVELT